MPKKCRASAIDKTGKMCYKSAILGILDGFWLALGWLWIGRSGGCVGGQTRVK